MSIFKSTFIPEVRNQLKVRQDSIHSRKPEVIHQLNTRNAWIRMTSSVNVNGTNELAKKYILQGGALENGAPKPGGIGNSYEISPTRGIRPMPGIIGVDIKSKTAYGSLREATISFSCNSIEQLEDLELLYMRPGYTALLEWGWSPYIDNTGKPVYTTKYYENVINGGKSMDQIFRDLFQLSRTSNGNYDALFGKVMNYSWTARPDGGYDCQTTLISIGEVIESLKVNSVPLDVDQIAKDGGILGTKIDNKTLKDGYSLNKLNGLLVELDEFAKTKVDGTNRAWAGEFSSGKNKYDLFAMVVAAQQQTDAAPLSTSIEKTYITLESFTNLLNEHVLLKVFNNNGSASEPIAKISTKTSPIIYGSEDPLTCLGHPYQVSVDVNTCLISNDIFAKEVKVNGVTGKTTTPTNNSTSKRTFQEFATEAGKIFKELRRISPDKGARENAKSGYFIGDEILKAVAPKKDRGEDFNENLNEFIKAFYVASDLSKNPQGDNSGALFAFFRIIKDPALKKWTPATTSNDAFFSSDENRNKLTNSLPSDASGYTNYITAVNSFNQIKKEVQSQGVAVTPRGYLSLIDQFAKEKFKRFHQDNNSDQLGIIGNIYLNINMLKQLATSNNIGNDKREVQLYSYLKTIMGKVQESIGNINNFDIHIDPADGNVGRIIDVSFTESNEVKRNFKIPNGDDEAFLIEVANTKSIVRSYDLQSQIFPNQSSLIAIGAQVEGSGGGGTQGTQNYTLLSFNRGITDRNLPAKIDSTTADRVPSPKDKQDNLKSNLNLLNEYLFPNIPQIQLDANRQENAAETTKYKNALRDVIAYGLGIDNSPIRSNSIIPIKLSITLDGIGGMIIGNLFRISDTVLPKGYKFESNTGSRLFQVVTGISHKIQNNDWTTTIDAYNIILDDDSSKQQLTIPSGLTNQNQASPTGNRTAPDTTDDGLKYPFSGKFTITSVLGDSRGGGTRTHNGIDLAIPSGTTIYAVEAGTIITADSNPTDDAGGIEIRMSHNAAGSKLNGKITQYSHLSSLSVKANQVVAKGEPIGTSGNTGNSGTGKPYGAHLHFEVRSSNGAVENPATYFPLFG